MCLEVVPGVLGVFYMLSLAGGAGLNCCTWTFGVFYRLSLEDW